MKKIKNLIKLSCKVAIYVPSTNNVNVATDNSEQVTETLKFLSGCFGGATSTDAIGCWESETEGLIRERIVVCFAYCNSDSLDKHINLVVDYCEKLKREMLQEAISLEVNNELYFV
jgi:hypothetical protein